MAPMPDAFIGYPPRIAAAYNVIVHNRVMRNRTIDILLTDACTAIQIPGNLCTSLGFDPLSETTPVEFNVVQGNGFNPFPGLPGADSFRTGVGAEKCGFHNIAPEVFPPALPVCPRASVGRELKWTGRCK